MSIGSRLKNLEEASNTGFKVILPNAFRADGAAIIEHDQRDEMAVLVYLDEPPLRIERGEEEDIWEFQHRAECTAKDKIKDAFVMGWNVQFL